MVYNINMRKYISFWLFFIPFFTSCHAGHEKEIKLFWSYIQKNEKQLFELSDSESPLWHEIDNHIRSIDSNIYVTLENDFDEKGNIIITCKGKYEYFDLCDQIVRFAPDLKYFVPISLFPPLDKIDSFVFGDLDDLVVTVDDVKVEYFEEIPELFANYPNKLSIRIGQIFEESKDFDEYRYIDTCYRWMVEIMTQQIIGERLFGEKIKKIGTGFPEQAQNTFPIMDLKNYFK